MTDIAELRRKAEAVPLGPWTCERQDGLGGTIYYAIHSGDYSWITNIEENKAVGEYIAATSPDVVLALLDRIKEGRKLRKASNRQTMTDGWLPISGMPWQKVCWVKNNLMKDPILATRGFSDERGVHPDRTFCTSVYMPHEFGAYPSGKLVCPTVWKERAAALTTPKENGNG